MGIALDRFTPEGPSTGSPKTNSHYQELGQASYMREPVAYQARTLSKVLLEGGGLVLSSCHRLCMQQGAQPSNTPCVACRHRS